ncbi:MAG: amino acid ABC transporter substrate-binding protein, partial [Acidimicrobiia bacterium]|nr:amino acid ABC transporter substrate-binding protein [Acidimicrobiia bacterium]
MRHRYMWSLILVLVLVAAACGSDTTEETDAPDSPATTQPAATEDTTSDETTPTETTEAMDEPMDEPMFAGTIRLGAAVSDTGKYAREGQDTRQGYDLWLDWVNNEYGGIDVGGERYQVEIVYYDDEGDPDTAASLVEKLVTEDEVDYLLGPYSSGLTMSTSAIAEKYNVIMVEGNGASESIFERGFKNIFAVLTPAGNYTQSALKALADQGATSVVIAYEDTAFPTSVAAGAEKWAIEYGLEILAIESYPKDVADVSNIITTFKNADPDVFVGGGHFNDALLFVRAAKEQGWTPDAMVITVGPSNPDFAAEVGTDANFILGPTQWERTMGYSDEYFGTAEEYAQRYETLWGEPPSYQAAESTATALSLHLAIEAAGVLDTDAVRQALYDLDIVTFYGPINFDDTG